MCWKELYYYVVMTSCIFRTQTQFENKRLLQVFCVESACSAHVSCVVDLDAHLGAWHTGSMFSFLLFLSFLNSALLCVVCPPGGASSLIPTRPSSSWSTVTVWCPCRLPSLRCMNRSGMMTGSSTWCMPPRRPSGPPTKHPSFFWTLICCCPSLISSLF